MGADRAGEPSGETKLSPSEPFFVAASTIDWVALTASYPSAVPFASWPSSASDVKLPPAVIRPSDAARRSGAPAFGISRALTTEETTASGPPGVAMTRSSAPSMSSHPFPSRSAARSEATARPTGWGSKRAVSPSTPTTPASRAASMKESSAGTQTAGRTGLIPPAPSPASAP